MEWRRENVEVGEINIHVNPQRKRVRGGRRDERKRL